MTEPEERARPRRRRVGVCEVRSLWSELSPGWRTCLGWFVLFCALAGNGFSAPLPGRRGMPASWFFVCCAALLLVMLLYSLRELRVRRVPPTERTAAVRWRPLWIPAVQLSAVLMFAVVLRGGWHRVQHGPPLEDGTARFHAPLLVIGPDPYTPPRGFDFVLTGIRPERGAEVFYIASSDGSGMLARAREDADPRTNLGSSAWVRSGTRVTLSSQVTEEDGQIRHRVGGTIGYGYLQESIESLFEKRFGGAGDGSSGDAERANDDASDGAEPGRDDSADPGH